MTKEEALEVWRAAVEWESDPNNRASSAMFEWQGGGTLLPHGFDIWWNERAEKPARETQTTTTGDSKSSEVVGHLLVGSMLVPTAHPGSVPHTKEIYREYIPMTKGSTEQTTKTGDGIPYEYISSTSTAPDSFFGRVASAGGAKDTES